MAESQPAAALAYVNSQIIAYEGRVKHRGQKKKSEKQLSCNITLLLFNVSLTVI